jgi:ERCC4-type nuclease
MVGSSNRKKAKHESNQEGLDLLWEKHEQVSKQPNSKFVFTISKAIKSVQACTTAITTTKEAKALHGVGDSIARMIIKKPKDAPDSLPLSRAITSTTAAAGRNNVDSSAAGAKRLQRKEPPPPPPPDGKAEVSKASAKQKAYEKAVEASETLILPTGQWKVVLVVDGREHGWEKVMAKLQMSGVPSEKRHLPIGDMAWIAKSGDTEVMLGTIIERKAVADLASSLFGTRYNEQRLRLQHSGLPQVFLLVEGDTKDVSNCPHDTLQMAMMETRVQLGFQVVQTRHLEDSIRFLKSVHRRILQRAFPSAFGGVTVGASLPTFSSPGTNRRRRRRSIKKRDKADRRSFEEMVFDIPPEPAFGASRFITYNELKCKIELDREEGTKTIRAVFCGMLKQIPKVSNTTVAPIVHAFPTPDALFRALDGLDEAEGKSLLADLDTGTSNKRVGDQKAFEIYHTFMSGGDDSIIAEQRSAVEASMQSHKPAAAVLPPIQETRPKVSSKPSPPATVEATVQAIRRLDVSEIRRCTSEASNDCWDKWEAQQDASRSKSARKDTRQSLESIDSVDAMFLDFNKQKPVNAETICIDLSSDEDEYEYERKIPASRVPPTKKLAPLQQKRSAKPAAFSSTLNPRDRSPTHGMYESSDDDAKMSSKASRPSSQKKLAPQKRKGSGKPAFSGTLNRRATSPRTHNLCESSDDDRKMQSKSSRPSPAKRARLSSRPPESNSDCEEDIPLQERIKNLRERLDLAKGTLTSESVVHTVAREVSISEDEDIVPKCFGNQEVIELSD